MRASGPFTIACLFLAVARFAAAEGDGVAATSCIACHSDPEMTSQESSQLVDRFRSDVHAEVGLSCHDCHGGNPDPALAGDMAAAMDEGFRPHPYTGVPKREAIPALCARCHSDPAFMKRFKPDIRTDQESEYWTSQHGKALRTGNTRVATCADCHGVHGILRAADSRSPVYPTHVAETCRSCHGDRERMMGSVLPDGRPLPVDQYARWRQSVHAAALLDRGDLSAPTCNDCHGNHGAVPPGLDSIAFVCGQCHLREAELFRESVKHAGFQEHNQLLDQAEGGGCRGCHSPPEPAADVVELHRFSECTSCHTNHGVVRPTMAMFADLPETPCAFCHEGQGPLSVEVPEPRQVAERYESIRDGLLAEAARQGFEGEERFDWLVDQALQLPTHTVVGPVAMESPLLRPEFEHLFTKFRIGKTHHTFEDPATAAQAKSAVVRCSDCHGPSGIGYGSGVGLATSNAFLIHMRELTALTARAERLILTARRGGVETRTALQDIDEAVNAQIELEVLVHTFSSADSGAFMAKHKEGIAHAQAALFAGRHALREIHHRRLGLYVALGFIVLVLVGLALMIRSTAAIQEESVAPGGNAHPGETPIRRSSPSP